MTVSAQPEAILSPLPKADGSATYSHAGYTITASANGPVEAQKRDEHPYEALVDVVVRPASGVGGTRERHLESLLQQSLRQLILVKDFPRCVVQIVLQVTATPTNEYVNTKLVQASSNLLIIPALLQTAVLALVSSAVPMRATATSAVAAISPSDGETQITMDPSPREADKSRSVHVLAFTSFGELLLAESEGDFSMAEWDQVYEISQSACCGAADSNGTHAVLDEANQKGPDMRQFIRSAAEIKVAADLYWK